jgi:hypothetical protein
MAGKTTPEQKAVSRVHGRHRTVPNGRRTYGPPRRDALQLKLFSVLCGLRSLENWGANGVK